MSFSEGFFSFRPAFMHAPFSSAQFGALARDDFLFSPKAGAEPSGDVAGFVLKVAAIAGAVWVIYHIRDEVTLGVTGATLATATIFSDWLRESKIRQVSAGAASVIITGLSIFQLEKTGVPEGTITGLIAQHPQGALAVVGTTLTALYAKSIWKYKVELLGVGVASSLALSAIAGVIDGIHDNIVHHELNPIYATGKAIADTNNVSLAMSEWAIDDLAPNPLVTWSMWGANKVVTMPAYVGAGVGGFVGNVLADGARGVRAVYRFATKETASPPPQKPNVKVSVNFEKPRSLPAASHSHLTLA